MKNDVLASYFRGTLENASVQWADLIAMRFQRARSSYATVVRCALRRTYGMQLPSYARTFMTRSEALGVSPLTTAEYIAESARSRARRSGTKHPVRRDPFAVPEFLLGTVAGLGAGYVAHKAHAGVRRVRHRLAAGRYEKERAREEALKGQLSAAERQRSEAYETMRRLADPRRRPR